jgi:hypothetical protein
MSTFHVLLPRGEPTEELKETKVPKRLRYDQTLQFEYLKMHYELVGEGIPLNLELPDMSPESGKISAEQMKEIEALEVLPGQPTELFTDLEQQISLELLNMMGFLADNQYQVNCLCLPPPCLEKNHKAMKRMSSLWEDLTRPRMVQGSVEYKESEKRFVDWAMQQLEEKEAHKNPTLYLRPRKPLTFKRCAKTAGKYMIHKSAFFI